MESKLNETSLDFLSSIYHAPCHAQWERMMRCDGLPDPTSVPEMNRYLSLWQADPASATLEGALAKTDQVIHVISELENVMEETRDATEKQLRDWKEIWLQLQEAQKGKLDQATYHQLLDLRPHLDHETMVYSFFTSSPLVSLALWSNTTRSPKNNNHQVKELGFTFTLPADLSEAECVVRVMRTEYDHYSKFARTYNPPLVPETCGELIGEGCGGCGCARLFEGGRWGFRDEEEPEETPREDPPADKEGFRCATSLPPGAPQVSTKKAKPPHYTDTAPGELNLRRYRVQGGVYTVDLLEVPPQPRVLADCRQSLILLIHRLPDSAFWFEPPQMVLWDENKRCWSTDYFHDVKYNEDQCVMQVRTMRLGVMGLAMNRYANLPFQSWEMKPKGASSVSLTLIAAVVVADFTITEGQVCLANLQDGARTALSHLYGKNMKPGALIKTLQFYGINLFPDRDSYCYIDGLPTKHRPTEQHLYRCMALVAPAVHFAWSRWNLLAGKTKLVFQMKTKKLVTDESQVGQPLVLVTPQRTCVLECTEISQSFSNNPEEPNKYYADLYQMVLGDLGSSVRQTVEAASPVFIHTIHSMLKSASVISYC
ncbi:axonemal 84 kDa protein-like [Penaeus monodon]|uniref:axonemal 84 kDa protein-like n=1 Tax=Penaeus monodon TaxID=6687 RepID=UPI0018A77D4E|nr:axonemal 84 kDa protein-like [Penaeus monodon]